VEDSRHQQLHGEENLKFDQIATVPSSPTNPFVGLRGPAGSFELRSMDGEPSQVVGLPSRLHTSEDETKSTRSVTVSTMDDGEATRAEQDQALMIRVSQLEAQLAESKACLIDRNSTLDSLRQSLKDFELQKEADERRLRDIEWQLAESVASANTLQETLGVKETREIERDAILAEKNDLLSLLEDQVKKTSLQLESEKRELTSQVEELRRAGQVREGSSPSRYQLTP
jgi:CAP-Gly domain-containing linker protein 1